MPSARSSRQTDDHANAGDLGSFMSSDDAGEDCCGQRSPTRLCRARAACAKQFPRRRDAPRRNEKVRCALEVRRNEGSSEDPVQKNHLWGPGLRRPRRRQREKIQVALAGVVLDPGK